MLKMGLNNIQILLYQLYIVSLTKRLPCYKVSIIFKTLLHLRSKLPIPLKICIYCSNIISNCTKKNRIHYAFLTHYQTTNFRLFQLKEFADDNFKFDENSRKLSKWVENTVEKGEIARYEQYLLFPTVFSKGLFPRGVKRCHCVGMS